MSGNIKISLAVLHFEDGSSLLRYSSGSLVWRGVVVHTVAVYVFRGDTVMVHGPMGVL